MRVIRKLDQMVRLIDRAFLYISGLLVLCIVFSVSASVIMRNLFGIPLSWSVEVSEYLMVYITFLTIAWTLREDGHVKVEVLSSRLSSKVKEKVNVFIFFVSMVIFLILFWFSLRIVIDLYQRNVVSLVILAIPSYILILPISVGSLLFSIRSFLKMFNLDTEDERVDAKVVE